RPLGRSREARERDPGKSDAAQGAQRKQGSADQPQAPGAQQARGPQDGPQDQERQADPERGVEQRR
ncbi:MAG: hypothetical protein ACRD3Q_02870, partial [Terriglobales bacterium]